MIEEFFSKYFDDIGYLHLIEHAAIFKYELDYFIFEEDESDVKYIVVRGNDKHDEQESLQKTTETLEEFAGVKIISWKALKNIGKKWLLLDEVDGNLDKVMYLSGDVPYLVAKIELTNK